jgi:hypothetical protein
MLPPESRPESDRQRRARKSLRLLRIDDVLDAYHPVLAGTIPLGIDVDGSDLDVICQADDPDAFAECVRAAYDTCEGFRLRRKLVNDLPTVIASFHAYGFPVEIFGQPRPVTEQNAYRHMRVEARLLAIGGDEARRGIHRLKAQGMKTELAFAQYFGLQGDPYQALLELAKLDEITLRAAITGG